MRIVCPYTDLQEATELALTEYGNQVEYVDVSGSTEDYFWLLYRLWKEREAFIVVEHDHVPWKGALIPLAECEKELCCYQTPMSVLPNGQIMWATGIVKYSKSLMERFPRLLENAPADQRQWTNAAEYTYLRLGPIHVHEPPIEHINPERMSMDWNTYCQFRQLNGPVKPRKGRGPNDTRQRSTTGKGQDSWPVEQLEGTK